MKKILFFLIAFISCNLIFAQDYESAKSMCRNYGFTENTDSFANCVQKEISQQKSSNACLSVKKGIEDRVQACTYTCMSNARYTGIAGMNSCVSDCQLMRNQLPPNC